MTVRYPRWLVRRFGLSAVGVACALNVVSGANAARGRVVMVERGSVAGQEWSLAVDRTGREMRCFRLMLGQGNWYSAAACEGYAQHPSTVWRRVTGIGDESVSVELDVVTPGVRRLKLLFGYPGRHPVRPSWQTSRTRALSRWQVRHAHVRRSGRYVVLSSDTRNLCVQRVIAYARTGRVLKRMRVPCEF